jgi:hypothetical protein
MKTITYRFEVRATSQLSDDPEHPDHYTEETATSPAHRRRLERALFALLKSFDMQCDVELMDFTVEDDGLHAADCACESCQMERAADTAQEPRHE